VSTPSHHLRGAAELEHDQLVEVEGALKDLIQVPKPWTPQSESQRIHEALEQILYAEQMGFANVWFSEHHFRPVGPHPGEPTSQEVREHGTSFCVDTPADCIRFLEMYEALGIEEVFLLCAIGPAQHQEVLQTMRFFGEQVIPHFQAKGQRAAVTQVSA